MRESLHDSLADMVRHHVQRCLRSVIASHVDDETVAEFQQAHLALECLPLATAEYALARNRLENARHYLWTGEPGAALYELRLLLRGLGVEESF
jgi:hypothetical protein